MTDISKGGIGILYPLAAETGIKLTVLFDIPTDTGIAALSAKAVIHYVHFSKNLFHIGLEFHDIKSDSLKIISTFIQKKLKQKKTLST